MAFQDFKYKVHDIIGYIDFPKSNEVYDYTNEVKAYEDEYGYLVDIETNLVFDLNTKEFICQGSISYFIPKQEEEFFDFKYIIVELIYQSFCRQAGYIYNKHSEIPKLIPSVYNLYQDFKLSDIKKGF